MKKKYRVTRRDLQIFKMEFTRLQLLLNLNDWDVEFTNNKLDGHYADIKYNIDNRMCTVNISTECECKKNYQKLARHEVFHLFLAELMVLAKTRFLTNDELSMINEKMCTVFEKLEIK